jgi:hypothetical protein
MEHSLSNRRIAQGFDLKYQEGKTWIEKSLSLHLQKNLYEQDRNHTTPQDRRSARKPFYHRAVQEHPF